MPLKIQENVSLFGFLDAYSEPAFILCSNTLPRSSLAFPYGNPALRKLFFGHSSTERLDEHTFFSALPSDEDVAWLSNPAQDGSHGTLRHTRRISIRPARIPRDRAAFDLEFTATTIDLPVTVYGVIRISRSYVFIASPHRPAIGSFQSESQVPQPSPIGSGLRHLTFPSPIASTTRQSHSRRARSDSKSDTSARPSPASSTAGPVLPSELIETFPWEATPLGPKEKWPMILKLMVKHLMEKPIASSILWGWPDQIIIYNDAYARVIGGKHPGVFGQPGPVAWGEVWEARAPASDLVRKGKATTKTDAQMFFNSLTELHLPEEIYHTWHWSPIWIEDGSIGGIWDSTWDTTQKVIAERRLSGMSELFSRLSDTRTKEQFSERTLEVLSRNPYDLPFIALYWCEAEKPPIMPHSRGPSLVVSYFRRNLSNGHIDVKLTLGGSVGIPDDHPIAQSAIKYTLDSSTYRPIHISETASGTTSLGMAGASLSSIHTSENSEHELGVTLARVFISSTAELINPLPAHLARSLDGRGFKDLPRAAAILPISANSSSSPSDGRRLPSAVLLLGLNTRRAYDADYAAWLDSIGAGLGNQLAVVLQREADARLIEEQERVDKAKTMFFTNVSHELRTPLTLIQAPLEQLVASQREDADAQYKLQLAVRNCKRLKKLIDSILDMSKLEAGKLVGNFRPVQLGHVTADLAAQFRSMAEKKGIEYEISYSAADEPSVYVDIDLWEKIILNLLSNAFKYTSKGSVRVNITHDPVMAYVVIKDTGIGIPKEYVDHVFERFFRTAEGTGVGLSLAKELVSLHGGTLSLESQTREESGGNSGSVFTVSLPHGSAHLPAALVQDVAQVQHHGILPREKDYWVELDQPTPPVGSDGVEDGSALSTLFFEKEDTILIVDDNADMRAYVSKIFAPHVTVLEAHNGVEALRVAQSRSLNLVDVMMPKMDGPEFLRRLREARKTRLLPVMFVTAAEDPDLLCSRVEGAVDCINKPFKVRDLLARAHLQLQIGKRLMKLEAEFEARSHELQILTEMLPVGIFKTDADGKLTYLNPAWYQITGLPMERSRDEWLDQVNPGSREEAIRVWRECFETRRSSSAVSGRRAKHRRLQWKNNVWTHYGISPLMAPTGVLLGSFGAITDINETYLYEEARVALAEEREHVAASKAEDAEAQRQLEVERRRAQELLIDVTSHELRQPVSAIIQNAEVVQTNMKELRDELLDCMKRNISYVPSERMLTELDDDLQAMESITQCGLAQARIANDVLSLSRIQLDVLSIIPTDFNIRKETDQILMVFRNELATKDISFDFMLGPEAETLGLHIVRTDRSRYAQIITNLMSNAIRFTEMSPSFREIKVSLELSTNPPSDESCVPPSRTTSFLSPVSGSEDAPVYIYISVQDSGPGLRKEDLSLLFQRFQQGSNAHHVFGGSGLGLFVCRQLCTLMGGRIEVESELGKGATFRFFIKATLPSVSDRNPQSPVDISQVNQSGSAVVKADGVPEVPSEFESQPLLETHNSSDAHPLHVLITEDNKINQTVLARQMKRENFTYALASNGLESIQAIEESQTKQRFDAVLMDLEMPVLDGFSATREIRKREASGSLKMRSFIIALTGNARLEQVQAARDAGVDDVMIKPYQIDTLISKMRAGYQYRPE